MFCQTAGLLLVLLFMRSLLSLLWMLLLIWLGLILPFGLLVGFNALIALCLLSLMEVQLIWDVYIREVGFVPFAVREQLFRLCNSPDVDSSWLLWSREAEASLARAYLSAGGPPLSNPCSYVGRGSVSICSMRLGGRCHGSCLSC